MIRSMIRVRHRRGASLEAIAAEHGLAAGSVRLVARPSRWGNPFDHRRLGRPEAVRRYEATLAAMDPAERDALVAPLAGAEGLACYCPPDEPCHADVLIRLFSERPARGSARRTGAAPRGAPRPR